MTLRTYLVQQSASKVINVYTVKASSSTNAKKAAIAKGANPEKGMSVKKA